MCVIPRFAGSYMARCRLELFNGKSVADGWVDPSRQKAGFSGGRTADVIHTRPFSSNIGLWTLFLLVQIASSPQYGDAFGIVAGVRGVFGSRTLSFTWLSVLWTGSSTGR